MEAKEHHGLGRARSYGLAAVDEQVKMTAVAQNIKRLVTLILRRKKRAAKVMEMTRTALAMLPERVDKILHLFLQSCFRLRLVLI